MRKIALILCVALVLSFAGCGSNNSSEVLASQNEELRKEIESLKNENQRQRQEEEEKQEAEKEAFNNYIDKLNSLLEKSLESGSIAESICNLAVKVWYAAIYEKFEADTYKYTMTDGKYNDFNKALQLMYADDSIAKKIVEIGDSQMIVNDIMKELQSPPQGLEKCYDTATEMYSNFNNLTKLAINPTGTYAQFSENKLEAIDNYLKYYDLIKTQIPDKK